MQGVFSTHITILAKLSIEKYTKTHIMKKIYSHKPKSHMMMDTSLNKIKEQKTFVMIKPDGVRRNLVGDIITRFEQRQLKIIALKMIRPSEQDLNNHYPINDPTWVERLGHKSLTTFKDTNLDPKQHLGTNDPKEIGKSVVQRLISYMKDEPVVCMVVYGPNAILMARKIVGSTIPFHADI